MKFATPFSAALLAGCAVTPDYLPEESVTGVDGAYRIVLGCQRPKMRFPEAALRRYRAMHATTTLRIVILSDGAIGEVSIAKSSEDDELDRTAVRAGKALKCRGSGLETTALITFTFDIR